VGGWTLEAAEGVCACGSPGEFEVLDGLASLVDKSLVEVQVNAGEAHRYRMLETVRHYAKEKLSAGGEDRSARNRHLAYFAAFAEDMDRKVHTPDYHTGLAQLDAEMDNFRAALGWGLGAEQRSKAEDWLCLAAALGWYWHLRELEIEGYDWLSRGLECLPEEPAPSVHLRAMACYWAAWLGERICVPPQTWLQFSRRSVSLCRQAGDRLGLAFALPFYGDALANVSPNLPYPRDYAAGLALIEEGIALNQELGTPWTLGVAYMAKARRTWQKEDNSDSRALYEKCIACFEQAGDVLSSALVKVELAFTALHHGDYETAQKNSMDLLELCRSEGLIYDRMLDLPGLIAYFQNDFARMDQYLREALSISKERGYYINRITWLTRMLGVAALLKGQIQRARQLFLESWAQGCKLKSGDRYGDPGSELALILWIGTLAERLGQPAQAARFLGAVESVLETFFKPLSTWDDLEYERVTDRVRTQLDEASLAVAWEAGRALTLEQALAEALAFCREDWAP
jgi:tetratricopeptide (TPR) repeat protein